MSQEVQDAQVQKTPKKRRDGPRLKINAKCSKCGKRMFRDLVMNTAYCARDENTTIGPTRPKKGTVTTAPRHKKDKDEKKSK